MDKSLTFYYLEYINICEPGLVLEQAMGTPSPFTKTHPWRTHRQRLLVNLLKGWLDSIQWIGWEWSGGRSDQGLGWSVWSVWSSGWGGRGCGVVGLSGQSEYQDLFRVHWRMIQIVNLKHQHTPELVIRIEFYNGQNSCKAGTLASIHGIANVSINCKTSPYEI